MKKLSLEEWEKKYIVGPIKRFDQKYMMFVRPLWDRELQARFSDWMFHEAEFKDKPGLTMQDHALTAASWRGIILEALNVDKPNPTPIATAIMDLIASQGGLPGPLMLSQPPKIKIDTSDQQRITRDLKKMAIRFGADLVGVTKLDHRWVYSHTLPDMAEAMRGKGTPESLPQEIPEEFQYAIVMAFEEDYDLLQYYPTEFFAAEIAWAYSKMSITSFFVAHFIRNLGFKVIDCTWNDVCLYPPLAELAGLGQLGRHGVLVTPQFGSRVRLAVVLTDLPLVADAPIEFGVTEFCEVCKKCAKLCPSNSIIEGERTSEPNNVSNMGGVLKWPIDAETCRMYWQRSPSGECGICMSVCPYSKVNTWPHHIVRWFTDHTRWLDPFFLKMDDLFGYGKPRKATNFWEEWKPRRH